MLLQLSSLGYILSMCCLALLFNAIWSSSSSTFKAVESSHFMVHESGGAASYANKDDYTITGLCYALLDITELLLHKKVDICAAHVEIYSALITSLSGHQTNLIHFLQPIKSCFLTLEGNQVSILHLLFSSGSLVLLPVFAMLVNCKICSLASVVVVALLNTLSRKLHNIGRLLDEGWELPDHSNSA